MKESNIIKLAVLITSYNRKKVTLGCLSRLYGQSLIPELTLHVFLLDDSSTDGTFETIQAAFPDVRLFRGDGFLYWNRGMHYIFGKAMEDGYDYYLWLNDDTFLYADAINFMLRTYSEVNYTNSIIVGTIQDPHTKKFSYGGVRRASTWNPLKLEVAFPSTASTMIECDTMNGNCVLIPYQVAKIVGNLDPHFNHRWGDFDYGFRAKKRGCRIFATPQYIGTCKANDLDVAWRGDSGLAVRDRVKVFHSIKGYKPQEWMVYAKRHGGNVWLLNFLNPYLDLLFPSIKKIFKPRSIGGYKEQLVDN